VHRRYWTIKSADARQCSQIRYGRREVDAIEDMRRAYDEVEEMGGSMKDADAKAKKSMI